MVRPPILLIEDSPDSLEALVLLLESQFECKAVSSRDEALRLIKAGYVPACIISDYSMPGMSLEDFLSDACVRDLKVILLSAHTQAVDTGQGVGIKRVLTKPAEPDAIVAAIRQSMSSGEHPAV